MTHRMLEDNLALLRPQDELKLVLADQADYEFAKDLITLRWPDLACPVTLSTVWESLEPRQVAEWMIKDRLPARLQLQLHKCLWGAEAKGV